MSYIQINWQSAVTGMINNFAFIFFLIYLFPKLEILAKKVNKIISSVIIGVCFGFCAVIVMKYPIVITNGVFFDSRLIVLSLTGLFGSWISVLVAIIISGSFRLIIGGMGAFSGTIMIILSGISGIIFANKKLQKNINKYYILLLLGFVQALISQSIIFLLPYSIAIKIFKFFIIPSLIYHPVCILMLGSFLYHEKNYILIQEQIKESEIKFKSLFALSPDPIFIIDKKTGKILDVNNNVLNVYKYTREELLYMKDTDIFAEPEKTKRRAKNPINYDFIQYHKKKNGEIFPVSITTNTIKLNNKDVIITTIQDLNLLKRAEEELLREKEFIDKVINSQIDVYFVYDSKNKKAIRWNKSFEDISGYSFEEIASLKIPDSYFIKKDLQKANNAIKKILKNKHEILKLSLITKDKKEIPFEFQGSLIIDPLTQNKLIVVSGRNITEQLKIENTIKQGEIRYRSLIEQTTDAVFCYECNPPISINLPIDEQVKQLYNCILAECNDVCAKSYGSNLKPKNVIGKKLTDLFGTTSDSLDKFFANVIKRGYKVTNEEAVEILPDGSKRYFTNNGYGIIEDNMLIRIWGTFRDITEQKCAEEALFESEKQYRQLVDNSLVGIFKTNISGDILFANQAMADMLKYNSPEELMKVSANNGYANPEDRKEFIDQLIKKGFLRNFETDLINKGGDIVSVYMNAIIDNEIIFGMLLDITEKKMLEEEIRDINKILEKRIKERTEDLEIVNNELESFSYSISHDLRSPLRIIDGFANMLLEDYGKSFDKKGKHFLNTISSHVMKMTQLINDLLSFSRISRKEIDKIKINTRELIQEIYDELVQLDSERNINLILDNIQDIFGDRSMIKQLFVNLLSNALKYTRKKKKTIIIINSKEIKGENMIEYFIKDNGVGFDMKYYNKLFTVFQRLHSSKEYEGTGVGLALVQRIVVRHGGEVWAESKLNKGSAFYFKIPK